MYILRFNKFNSFSEVELAGGWCGEASSRVPFPAGREASSSREPFPAGREASSRVPFLPAPFPGGLLFIVRFLLGSGPDGIGGGDGKTGGGPSAFRMRCNVCISIPVWLPTNRINETLNLMKCQPSRSWRG